MFTVSCPQCNATYQLDEAKIGPQGRKLKCAKCGHIWVASAPAAPQAGPAVSTAVPQQQSPSGTEERIESVSPVAAPAPSSAPEQPAGKTLPQDSPSAPVAEAPLPDGEAVPPPGFVVPDLGQVTAVGRFPWSRWLLGAGKWMLLAMLLSVLGIWAGLWVLLSPKGAEEEAVQKKEIVVGEEKNVPQPGVVEPPKGVELHNIEAEFVQGEEQGTVFVVKGLMKNTLGKDMAMPKLRVEIVDEKNQVTDMWPVAVSSTELPAHAQVPWVVSFTTPPLEAMRGWRVVFTK